MTTDFSDAEKRELRDWAVARGSGHHRRECPACSFGRSPGNRKIQCLSVEIDADKAVFFCWHCSAKGAVRLQEMNHVAREPKPEVSKAVKAMTGPLDPVYAFLKTRGISKETAEVFNIHAASAFFPDLRRTTPAIGYPYKAAGKAAGSKLRSLEEKAHVCSKPLHSLFAGDLVDLEEGDYLIIAEGECLPGDTEVLTRTGWVPLKDYKGGDVAQWDYNRRISFVKPKAKIDKPYTGPLVSFSNSRGFVMSMTPGHRMPILKADGVLSVKTAEQVERGKSVHHLPRSGIMSGEGIGLSEDQIAFCLAVSADATIDVRKNSYDGGPARVVPVSDRYARMSFRKDRKIERLRSLLQRLELDHVETVHGNGMTFFGIPLPDWVPGRMLPWSWITEASASEREFIVSELVHWDGNAVPHRNQTEYSTKYLENAQWAQSICHTAGRVSTVIPRKNAYGEWFKVSLLHGKKDGSYQGLKSRREFHDGRVYCLTVPSSFLLVRYHGSIFVTGNCDAMSFFEAGIVNATSVPNGAQSFSAKDDKTFLWANKDIIEKVSKVYIASDSDEPGEKLAEELARRIGRHRCWRIEYPDGCKDANDVLMKLGGETLKGCFENAKPWPISGLYEADRYFVELDEIYDNGYGGRISTGLDAVDKLYSLAPGRLCIVTGIPNHGKTTFVNQLIVNAARLYGIKTAICSFETPPATHLGTMAEILVQKHFVEKENVAGVRMSKRELHSTYKFSLENFKFLQQDDGAKATVESLIERIKTAVFRWGVRAVVIDPYNYIQREASFESETQFIDDLLTRLRLTAVAYDLHIWFIAHTTKMQQNQDGSYQIPGGYHISGSGAWYAKADFGLTVYQVHDDPGTVKVVLWKVRFAWEGMKGEVKIMYDTSRNVYISNPNTDLGPWEADDDF